MDGWVNMGDYGDLPDDDWADDDDDEDDSSKDKGKGKGKGKGKK